MPKRSDWGDWRAFWALCWSEAAPSWNRADVLGSLVMLGLYLLVSSLGIAGLYGLVVTSEAWPLLLVVPFAVNLLAIAPYKVWQRERVRRGWLSIIERLTSMIEEGTRAIDAHGRPSAHYRVTSGSLRPGMVPTPTGEMLRFGNGWIARVNEVLSECPEYKAEFSSQGREIFTGREVDGSEIPVAVMQVDISIKRLREIIRDIRTTRLGP